MTPPRPEGYKQQCSSYCERAEVIRFDNMAAAAAGHGLPGPNGGERRFDSSARDDCFPPAGAGMGTRRSVGFRLIRSSVAPAVRTLTPPEKPDKYRPIQPPDGFRYFSGGEGLNPCLGATIYIPMSPE